MLPQDSCQFSPHQFSTRAIHVGQAPDPTTGAVITPLYQTSTFAQEAPGQHKGWDYTRCGNPTQSALEAVLASLEEGAHAFSFTSGVGALSTLCLGLFRPGDHLIVSDNVYGGTYRFLDKIFTQYQVDVSFVDMTDVANIQAALRPETRLIYMETPTNPLLKLVDIPAVVALAQSTNTKTSTKIVTVVDNTFASPYLQQPLTMGVDIVLQSTTKYIGGHSDVLGGALILRNDTYRDAIAFAQKTIGATPDPFACWLQLRGVKTLAVRMQQHCASALALAQFLESHPAIESVIYPGLPSHPQHALAKRQMPRGFGGMISLRVKGGQAEACQLMKNLKLFTLAESLGGVESLIEHPAIMTHASLEPAVRAGLGITDNLLRVSVGIEATEDLLADMQQALSALAVATA